MSKNRNCYEPDCGGVVWADGLCNRHYMRRYRTGVTKDGPRARSPFEARLWGKIDVRGPDECWEWKAPCKQSGYGWIGTGTRRGRMVLAHRAVWELENGPIPPRKGKGHGGVIMHTCDNRLCCNPAHLRLGTQKENVADMDKKGRRRVYSPPGSKRPKAKHTEEQIAAFKADKEGTIKERAARHGVTIGVAKQVLYAKRWSHVK